MSEADRPGPVDRSEGTGDAVPLTSAAAGERLLIDDQHLTVDDRFSGLWLLEPPVTPEAVEAARPFPVERVELPFDVVGCADFVTGDRLVVQAAEHGGDTGVWTVGIDGRDPEQLYAAEACNVQVGDVDPSGTRVVVGQTCDLVVDSGVVVVDLRTGATTPVATGFAGSPHWSPDGDWLAFGLLTLAQREPMGVWVARADGSGLRQVVEGYASFPDWVPQGPP